MEHRGGVGELYLALCDPSTNPPAVRKEYALSRGAIDLGRASKSDAAAHDASSGKFRSAETKVMSSRHARLTWEGGKPVLEDTGSTNGSSISSGGQTYRLQRGVKREIHDGDVLTFGRQVDQHEHGKLPVVLVARISTKSALAPAPAPSRTHFSVPSTARNKSLARSRTLTEQVISLSDEEGAEEDMQSTQFLPLSKQAVKSVKRVGFGLSEDDLLASQEDSDDGDGDLTMMDLEPATLAPLPRRPASSVSKAESVASLAAASNMSVRGSPVPLMDKASAEACAQLSEVHALSPSPVVAPEGDRPSVHDGANGENETPSFRLPSPLSPEVDGGSSPRLSLDNLQQADEELAGQKHSRSLPQHCATPRGDEEASEVMEDLDEEPLPQPSGLFSRPAPSLLNKRLSKLDSKMVDDSSDIDAMSQASHLPSPVLSAKDDADIWSLPDFGEQQASGSLEALPRLVQARSREASVPATNEKAVQTTAGGAFEWRLDDLGFAAQAFDEDVGSVYRASTPAGRDFSPPATSPLSKTLGAFLDEQEEQERLVQAAEREASADPPSSLFGDDGLEGDADEIGAWDFSDVIPALRLPAAVVSPGRSSPLRERSPELSDENILDSCEIVESQDEGVVVAAVDSDGEEEDGKAAAATSKLRAVSEELVAGEAKLKAAASVLRNLAQAMAEEERKGEALARAHVDKSDHLVDDASDVSSQIEEEHQSSDPDLDAFDLDLDGSVAGDVDEGNESEFDEYDGLGVEEERWEDGVSELVEAKDSVEKVTASDDDDGYTSEGKALPPHVVSFRSAASPLITPPRDILKTTAVAETGMPTPLTSSRKRRLSATDLEDQAQVKLQRHHDALDKVSDPLTGASTLASPAAGVVVQVAPDAGPDPAPKRRRLGSYLKSYALGVFTGAVLTVGGLSAFGALLEEE
ncbi:hypothetical protein JCM10213_004865 [Rhodosporidiobolus nylandii]